MSTRAKGDRTRQREAALLHFPSGACLFDREHPPKHIFLIKSGIVRVGAADSAVFDYLGAGDICGERCFNTGGATQVGRALTDVTACSVQVRDITGVSADRLLAGRVLRCLLQRMIRYEEAIIDLVSEPTERRLAKMLLRFRNQRTTGDWTRLPSLTNPEIACTIGTTRWQVSHFMNRLQHRGVVRRNSGLWVNFDSLRAFLGTRQTR